MVTRSNILDRLRRSICHDDLRSGDETSAVATLDGIFYFRGAVCYLFQILCGTELSFAKHHGLDRSCKFSRLPSGGIMVIFELPVPHSIVNRLRKEARTSKRESSTPSAGKVRNAIERTVPIVIVVATRVV